MSADKNPSIFPIQMEAIVYMKREKIDFSELHLIKGCNKTNRFFNRMERFTFNFFQPTIFSQTFFFSTKR